MSKLDRIREARQAVQEAALRRWIERSPERQKNLREVAERGIGAADSPMRNERYQTREAMFQKARDLRRIGALPLGLERRMGPTLDWTPFAPSDGARAAGRPVARVVELGGRGTQPVGIATCFLVSPDLILTNHHVFPTKADTVGTGANFLYEESDRGIETGVVFEIDAEAFFYSNEALDFALVGVKPRSEDGRAIAEFRYVPLIEATPKILIGQAVNIIQYPEGGPKRYAITQNRLVDLLDDGFLHYDTDTLEGSSGSPAYSHNWQLVGLHHAAIPEIVDGKIIAEGGVVWDKETMSEEKIHWIANEGIRVSALIRHLSGVTMADATKQGLLNKLVQNSADPADAIAKEVTQPLIAPVPSSAIAASSGHNFNFSGPVTLNVYAAASQSVAAVARPVESVIDVKAPEKVMRFDPDYKKREGYDPEFLDPKDPKFRVPVPRASEARLSEILKGKNGKPLTLKYHHFELQMNEARRLQMWSAVNVDYDSDLKSSRDRKEFGTDKWIPDPRIAGEAQIMDAEFYKPAGNIDRGHIVRREDNAWGGTEREIEFANSDTFHWTNCTPQHEAFNQSAPGRNDPTYIGMKGLWGDFENHVQANLADGDTRACILAGPVLSAKDPSHDFGYGDIQYPLQFWKVIAVPKAQDGTRRLTVFGFLLSQRDVVKKFGIEVFRPGRFKKYQVSLQRITELTGVEFDNQLHRQDVLRGAADEVAFEKVGEVKGIRGGR